MKTKFLFTMCAATLFVACTNEEFISAPENNFADRAKVNVMLGADMGEYTIGDASTRTVWESGKYKWEASDVLGACMVDAKVEGTPEYNNIVTNYPFTPVETITTPVESANFKTNTAVYEGTYVFYHGYQTDMTKGRKITVNFPVSQELNAEKPYAHLTANNFFVSPLIKIKGGIAYEANNTIPVQFTSLYSGFAPTLKNTSSEEVKVSKIEVYSAAGFKLGGDINTVTSIFGSVVVSDNADLKNVIGEKVETMRSADIDLYETAITAANNMVSITLPDMVIAAGASQEIRMLFPAGSYNQNDLTMKVYTNQGVFETKANPGNSAVKFNRDVFKTNTYEMSTFEYPAEFKIFSKKDWEYAVKFIQGNAYYTNHAATFALQADVTLTETTDIPAFSIYVDANSHKLILEKEDAEFKLAQDSYVGALEVAAGTTLNLDGKSFIESLTNEGTVTVSGMVSSKASVSDYATWKGTPKNYGISTLVNNGVIVVNGKLELGEVTPDLAAKSEIINNGTLAIVNNVTNSGKITNNNLLTVADSKALENVKDIVLGENCKVQCLGTAASIITNNNAAAIITLAAVKDVFVDNAGHATTTALIANTQGVTSVAITAASSLDALKDINEVNSATISGSWNKAAIDKVDAATTITNLIMEDATIDLNGVAAGFTNITNIIVNGTSAINNSSVTAQQLATATVNLTIAEEATLSVAKNVKFGKIDATTVATISVLGKLVNSGTILGDVTVGASDNTSATITNNEDAILTAGNAISDVNVTMTSIDNYGKILNEGKLYATKVDNKVVGVSVFQGNITAVTATVTEAGF
ncbi:MULTISPECIES: hypothetical protein [Bacteroides]|jgi:hypothetical protein|uniref:hypothetical protein n=1 Tax=Bacteroides TaxID=816 RepID=UPI000FF1822E|nr:MULTISPECIES: hypothetical protein [Bacteroides]RHL09367.1 hypothetical protein DW036_09145 [Bacteroides sp. AF39-11AC]